LALSTIDLIILTTYQLQLPMKYYGIVSDKGLGLKTCL